jgi:hypothetical protein
MEEEQLLASLVGLLDSTRLFHQLDIVRCYWDLDKGTYKFSSVY